MKKEASNRIRVVELFAGVGGFRLGLEGCRGRRKSHHKHFETIWFNQWEPSTKRQHAHEVYVNRFGEIDKYTNTDIAKVIDKAPEHDLLVGGFPCQDYSVARNLSAATGLEGKKGILWWSIYNILKLQGRKRPNYLMLENVDRLLSSPAKQRGRDFAIILSSLNQLGYTVEWRVINAADYGMPQRRRRVFILGYKRGSNVHKAFVDVKDSAQWICKKGLVQSSFPVDYKLSLSTFNLDKDPVNVSANFNIEQKNISPFLNAGVADKYKVYTARVKSKYNGPTIKLEDILLNNKDVSSEYFISSDDLERWEYLKGAKEEPRKAANGFEFLYKEGAVAFPEPLDKPSRTIITGEGGGAPSRFKHVIKTRKGYRRLTPIELERLCMFPDNHTAGYTSAKRAFFMGNALIVGVVGGLGRALVKFDSINSRGRNFNF